MRAPQGAIFRTIKEKLPRTACTSIVVAAEIQFGLRKGVSDRLCAQVEAVMSALDILPLESPVEQHCGDIRAQLQQAGKTIGANDLFIAAHARALGLTLVTNNLRGFERVPGLAIENWL